MATVKREFLIDRQGKSVVLYAGLLDAAHGEGLKSVTTSLIQIPSDENGQMAIVHAHVHTDRGDFDGIGDAGPTNVTRAMLNCTIRMAETRAKARALRDAINVGAVAFEELDDAATDEDNRPIDVAPDSRPTQRPPVPSQHDREQDQAFNQMGRQQSAPPVATSGDLATPAQIRAIYVIAKNQHQLSEAKTEDLSRQRFNGLTPDMLSKKQASDLITFLKEGQSH